MERRMLGQTSLSVPVIGMGTWATFNVPPSAQADVDEVVGAALAAGTQLFDSSPMYGAAEARLGAALAAHGRRRALVATKLWSNDPEQLSAQARFALATFGHVDVLQVHNLAGLPASLEICEQLRDAGDITAIGATHWDCGRFDDLAALMRTGRLDAIQVPYNPVERDVERLILPLAAELGIGVLVMRPFAEGALTRRLPDAFSAQRYSEWGIRTWGQALLAWALADSRCTAALPATRRAERAHENADAGAVAWPDDAARADIAALAQTL